MEKAIKFFIYIKASNFPLTDSNQRKTGTTDSDRHVENMKYSPVWCCITSNCVTGSKKRGNNSK